MKHVHSFYAFTLILLCGSQSGFGANLTAKCVDIFNCTLVKHTFVYCHNGNLTAVPICVKDVTLLDMSGNPLQSVSARDFPKSLNSLEVLILRNVGLKVVIGDTFHNLHKLYQLDLSENLISTVMAFVFSKNPLLESLNLSSNSIRKLYSDQLVSSSLRILDLSHGFLEFVDDSAFSELPALEWLNLRDNRLKTLSLEGNIGTVLVGGSNPWNCDCGFLFLSKKVDEANDKNFSCWETEGARRTKDEILLMQNDCEEKREKSDKSDNLNKLIPYIYTYSLALASLAILALFCCCCDRNARTLNEKMGALEPINSSSAREENDYTRTLLSGDGQVVTHV